MSSGIGFQRDPAAKEGNDGTPMVAFDLGQEVDLAAIEVWNYNEAAATSRGVKQMEVCGSLVPDGADAWQIPLGNSNHLNVANNNGPRQGYKDNRPEYFFGSGTTDHMQKFADVGVIALLFGRGDGINYT